MPYGDDPSLIVPLGDRVLVKVIVEEETRAGIIIPDMAKGRPEMAHVLSVGPGRYSEKTGQLIPMQVVAGDVVVFHRYGGTHIGGFDDDYILFEEKDLLAKVTDPEILAKVGSPD